MSSSSIIKFMRKIGALKRLPRTGWNIAGIKSSESIADHCFGVTILSMLLADIFKETESKLDTEKVLKMSIIHELAESQTGDIPSPVNKYMPHNSKSVTESAIIDHLFNLVDSTNLSLKQVWQELKKGKSLEAQIVLAADKLEMLIQALDYEKIGYTCLQSFWDAMKKDPILNDIDIFKNIFDDLQNNRKK